MSRYDFANILFGGPCNQRCPGCIGHLLDPRLCQDNLHEYPLRNQDAFGRLLRQHGVRQVVFTGTTTDPQLYEHEVRLMDWLRRQVPGVQISLHTNGQLAMDKMDIVKRYDRVTVSFPTFDLATFRRMTGTRRMPNLAGILSTASIPVKVSCLVTNENAHQLGEFLARCRELGVRRVVLRQQYPPAAQARPKPLARTGEELEPLLRMSGCKPAGVYRQNPVYDCDGMEVTCWDFSRSTSTALNLFSDGTISAEYLLIHSQKIYSSFTPSPSTWVGKAAIMKPR